MLSPLQLQDIADEIRAVQLAARQLEPFSARVPGFDLQDAYAVADLVHRERVARGERPVGRKLGFTMVASGPFVRSSYHAGEMAVAEGHVRL